MYVITEQSSAGYYCQRNTGSQHKIRRTQAQHTSNNLTANTGHRWEPSQHHLGPQHFILIQTVLISKSLNQSGPVGFDADCRGLEEIERD